MIIICFFLVSVRDIHGNKMLNFQIRFYHSNHIITFCPILDTIICMVSLRLLAETVNVKNKNKEMVKFTKKSISPKHQPSFVKVSSQENKGKYVTARFFHFIIFLCIIQNLKHILFPFCNTGRIIMYFFFISKKKLVNNSSNHLQNAYYLPSFSLILYLIFTTVTYISTIMSSITQVRKRSAREVR